MTTVRGDQELRFQVAQPAHEMGHLVHGAGYATLVRRVNRQSELVDLSFEREDSRLTAGESGNRIGQQVRTRRISCDRSPEGVSCADNVGCVCRPVVWSG